MTSYQLISTSPLARLARHPDPRRGFPAVRRLPDGATPEDPGDGMAYVPIEDKPTAPNQVVTADLTLERDGWLVRDYTPEELAAMQPPIQSRLAAARAGMSSLLASLPDESKKNFALSRVAIESLLDLGEINAAYLTLSEVVTTTQQEANVKATLMTAMVQFLP